MWPSFSHISNLFRFGEEAADNARVWKLYRDSCNDRDQDLLEGWNDTINILLIFVRHISPSHPVLTVD